MTTQDYLRQIKSLDEKINQRMRQAEEIRQKAFILSSPDISKDRVQTSPSSDAGLRFIDKAVDMERKIKALIADYLDIKDRIISQIQSLEDDRYVRVLYYRYVEYLMFPEIADRMNYSKDYVFVLHRDAIAAFEKDNSKYLLSKKES